MKTFVYMLAISSLLPLCTIGDEVDAFLTWLRVEDEKASLPGKSLPVVLERTTKGNKVFLYFSPCERRMIEVNNSSGELKLWLIEPFRKKNWEHFGKRNEASLIDNIRKQRRRLKVHPKVLNSQGKLKPSGVIWAPDGDYFYVTFKVPSKRQWEYFKYITESASLAKEAEHRHFYDQTSPGGPKTIEKPLWSEGGKEYFGLPYRDRCKYFKPRNAATNDNFVSFGWQKRVMRITRVDGHGRYLLLHGDKLTEIELKGIRDKRFLLRYVDDRLYCFKPSSYSPKRWDFGEWHLHRIYRLGPAYVLHLHKKLQSRWVLLEKF